jgi:murein DD-endopeptidase MepM/ murein hydrolase activator NlpD
MRIRFRAIFLAACASLAAADAEGAPPTKRASRAAALATIPASGTATISARSGANLRAGPGVEHRILALLRSGQVLALLERTRASSPVRGLSGVAPWYKVRSGGVVGWVWGALLRIGGGRPPAPAPALEIEPFRGTGTVFARVLNLRAGPSIEAKDIGNLNQGTRVELLARTRRAVSVPGYRGAFRWYRVRVSDRTGWAWGGFIDVGGKPPPARRPGGGEPVSPSPPPLPPAVGGRAIEPFSEVGAVFARSLNVRAEPSTSARVLGELGYGRVVRLHARTRQQYWVRGYRRAFRWYLVEAGSLRGWSWGGFINVGKRTPPERKEGGGEVCDPRRANCNRHIPERPPRPAPVQVVPSSGADISVFPVAGRHWSWHRQACGYNDYYHGRGVNHPNGHLGNDIFGALGTPIVAPVSGTVVRAGWGGSVGGNRVTIRRGSWYFYHAHLNAVARGIQAGAAVKAGQVIGYLGKTGSAQGTQPHLHFSIYPNDNYEAGVNPFPHLVKVDPQCRAARR